MPSVQWLRTPGMPSSLLPDVLFSGRVPCRQGSLDTGACGALDGPVKPIQTPEQKVVDRLQAASTLVMSPSGLRVVRWRAGVSTSLGGWGVEGVGRSGAPQGGASEVIIHSHPQLLPVAIAHLSLVSLPQVPPIPTALPAPSPTPHFPSLPDCPLNPGWCQGLENFQAGLCPKVTSLGTA